jgi:hypothetical protein
MLPFLKFPTLFWDISPYDLVEICQCFIGKAEECKPKDRGNSFLQSIGNILLDYASSHPNRQYSSRPPPQETRISRFHFFLWNALAEF